MTIIGSVVTLQVKGCNGVLEPHRFAPPPVVGFAVRMRNPARRTATGEDAGIC
jgi:hypothetical protein